MAKAEKSNGFVYVRTRLNVEVIKRMQRWLGITEGKKEKDYTPEERDSYDRFATEATDWAMKTCIPFMYIQKEKGERAAGFEKRVYSKSVELYIDWLERGLDPYTKELGEYAQKELLKYLPKHIKKATSDKGKRSSSEDKASSNSPK